MAYKITDECIACGTCASECPVEAITEGDGIFVIDADACIECRGSPQGRVKPFDNGSACLLIVSKRFLF